MSCIGISGFPRLQGGKETPADYSVATTFGDADIIVFHKIPDGAIYTTKNWLSSRQLDVVLKARNEKQ